MSSKLLDHVDHRIFVKSGPTVSLCYLQKVFCKICIIPYSTTRSLKKQLPHRKSKIEKGGGQTCKKIHEIQGFQLLKTFSDKFVNISAKFGPLNFKLNMQIRNYFENINLIVGK